MFAAGPPYWTGRCGEQKERLAIRKGKVTSVAPTGSLAGLWATVRQWFKGSTAASTAGMSEGPACPWPLPAQGIDLGLLFTVVAMVLFGLLMVYSSSFIYAQERTGDGFAFIKKQLLFAGVGGLALVVSCRVDYRAWARWAYPVLGVAMLLLVLIFVPGVGARVGGARRWLRLGGFGFQPGEFAKFAVIFFVAHQLERKQERIHTLVGGVLSCVIVPLPAMMLLLLQPDF
jgi:cell division protein FtsW (lipid II flippase)